MWFLLGFQNFIGKSHVSDDFCEFFVSDFKRIWHKSLPNIELLSLSQALNPLLEVSAQKLKDITLKLLKDKTVQKEIKKEKNDIFLKLESNILGMKFQFQILLNEKDGEMLYKELTLPLLLMLMSTQKKVKKLVDLIKDKDEEIEDYKQEYGIKSNCLATKPFSKAEFDCQESASDMFWDLNSFLDYMDAKLLFVETLSEVKSPEQLCEKKFEGKCFVDKDDANNKSVFQDKNLNQSKHFKPYELLNNQIIKRKKYNEGFKIKF